MKLSDIKVGSFITLKGRHDSAYGKMVVNKHGSEWKVFDKIGRNIGISSLNQTHILDDDGKLSKEGTGYHYTMTISLRNNDENFEIIV